MMTYNELNDAIPLSVGFEQAVYEVLLALEDFVRLTRPKPVSDRLSVLDIILFAQKLELTTMYFKGRVTLFFANNYLTEYRITMEF